MRHQLPDISYCGDRFFICRAGGKIFNVGIPSYMRSVFSADQYYTYRILGQVNQVIYSNAVMFHSADQRMRFDDGGS